MALQQVFSLTPKESYFHPETAEYGAHMHVMGPSFYPKFQANYRNSFDQQHTSDELYFNALRVGDGTVDYSSWTNRLKAPLIQLFYNLSAFEPHKEVALTFAFDALTESRVLIYTNAGLLDEEILHVGDDQFLLEVESTSALHLYFIPVNIDGSNYGGHWFFRGIDGYIA